MMKIFGIDIFKQKPAENNFSPVRVEPEGEKIIDAIPGGYYNYNSVDIYGGILRSESELIRKYRQIALVAEVEEAIEDVIDEIVVAEDSNVEIDLESVSTISQGVKKKIIEEHTNVLKLLHWNNKSYDLVKKFYIEGRIYFHKIIDNKNLNKGILEARNINSTLIKKIKVMEKQIDSASGTEVSKITGEHYEYNVDDISQNKISLTKDSVCYVNCAILNEDRTEVLSYIHRVIKPLNQLKMMEDSCVIYRLTRSTEKRIFYIDTGNLPAQKAEQYLMTQQSRFKNKINYNPITGELTDSSKTMALTEDFWLPRREGGRGTAIETLSAGQNLGQIEDIEYFKSKFLDALKIPKSRRDDAAKFSLGRSSEITRDELKFQKYVDRVRKRFSYVFLDLLKTQLVMKKIITEEEWESLENDIVYVWPEDSHFKELKETELLKERIGLLRDLEPYIGKYYSHDFIRKQILKQNDKEIENMDKQIEEEKDKYPTDEGEQDNGE